MGLLKNMGLLKKEKRTFTMEEAFFASQEGFDAKTVMDYQEKAPLRELFSLIEDIKGAMQRKADVDEREFIMDKVIVFVENSEKLYDFFDERGFDVVTNAANVSGRTSMHFEVRW